MKNILADLTIGDDYIYSTDFVNTTQLDEIKLREAVANKHYNNYLAVISNHHSVSIMDKEVEIFLRKIPKGGCIIDVGGCWGWHWRNISHQRPDVKIVIVDFIRLNLYHAKKLLNDIIDKQVFLVHGDATDLKFIPSETFDGYWSVQTLQHIPDFNKAVYEANRVLKLGGVFANYSLNIQSLIKFLFKVMGKSYHIKGQIQGSFYLCRASEKQYAKISEIFSNDVKKRYTEILFNPGIKLKFAGKEGSFAGKIDCLLSSNSHIFSSIARQLSFHTTKSIS